MTPPPAPLVPPWRQLSERLRASEPYRRLRDRLGEVVRLPVPAAAWVFELLARDLGRPLLVVVPRESDALAWGEGSALVTGADEADAATVFFPGPSLTPYQEAAASLNVRAREAVALDRLLLGAARTVVTTPRALFRRLPRPRDFTAGVVPVRPDEDHPLEELTAHLVTWGYRRQDMVTEVGDLAVRGGLVDVWPPGTAAPVRIEFFGDTVETVRGFDPVSQRSEERLDETRLLPVVLHRAGPGEARRVADLLLAQTAGRPDPEVGELLEALRQHGEAPGWENYLPLLAEETVPLVDLVEDALVVAVDPEALEEEVERYGQRLEADYQARLEAGRPAVPPDELEEPVELVHRVLAEAPVRLGRLVGVGPGTPEGNGTPDDDAAPVDFAATTTDLFQGQLPRFQQEVELCERRGERCLVVAPAEHVGRFEELLEGRGIALGEAPGGGSVGGSGSGVEVVAGELERGFRLPAAGLAVYGERQLLPRAAPQRPARRRRPRYGPFVSSLRDLKVGDFIVHADHGIGQFVGLRRVGPEGDGAPLPPTLAGETGGAGGAAESVEVMEIAYASGQRLLLPLSRLDQVQKYSGIEGTAPRLDKLGGTSWNKTKARVKKSVQIMAGELLKLYAERQVAEAPAMPEDGDMMRQFEAAFPYEETADQLDAIADIKKDLASTRPMDRLLCGDVGYGKTEVAMRAALKAVEGGYQVAVLAPTTILADQHLETFRERFGGFPVEVEMISRFRQPAEIQDIGRRVAAGEVDILVGTHRLLSKDIRFARLGLLIVDEEQRFGVAQKERLKKLKREVHVLAMSATPVPRTLQLSLAGVRDLSVIETPPKDRMAVETAILPFNTQVVREAIEYELERGGQVYYVYNRVESIEAVQSMLHDILPGLRVTVGHGQLDEQELSRRMHAFTAGEYDVLLATTIIENGIDIPNVNTMIVHRADRFGLAQLYQLRGRVGRSNQLAYCYLLVPGDQILSETARKRLAAIREFTDLGAGFRIAARDLEIRGAGNLLGAEQSGHIVAVGIETYLKMLEDAVRELQGETVEEEGPSTAIDLPVPMAIPPEYVEDANLRMEIYRKIAAGEQDDDDLLAELEDRFGPPPPAVHSLLEVAALKRRAEELRIQAVSAREGRLTVRLRRDARVDVERLIELVSNRPGARFSPSGVLTVEGIGDAGLIGTARDLLSRLAPENGAPSGTKIAT